MRSENRKKKKEIQKILQLYAASATTLTWKPYFYIEKHDVKAS